MITEEKALHVARRIADDPKEIVDIVANSTEYYFKFKGHAFSILQRSRADEKSGLLSFYVYPKWTSTTEDLKMAYDVGCSEDIIVVTFNSGNSPEAEDVFSMLFRVVGSQHTGLDEIFDDILN